VEQLFKWKVAIVSTVIHHLLLEVHFAEIVDNNNQVIIAHDVGQALIHQLNSAQSVVKNDN